MQDDKYYMERCLELAMNGLGFTSPNPIVGCVIVFEGEIIGEGCHQRAGGAHAEVNAINAVKDKTLLSKSTLYVNLEPCSHYGKTPPCSQLILEYKIPRIVIGIQDCNPKVSGQGIATLREAGCEVCVDILQPECFEINKRFFTFHQERRPYVILKWAQTRDGFIDINRKQNDPQRPTWITNETARLLVHKWRAEEDAILVGTHTARIDNPELTVRLWPGKNPLRLIIDRHLTLPKNLNLFDGSTPTLVFNEKRSELLGLTEYICINFNPSLREILDILYKKDTLSLIVEGGEKLLTSFIKEGLWNEARVFTSEALFKEGVKAPIIKERPLTSEHIGDNDLTIYRNSNIR